jgi:hypothetical protein
VWHPRSCTDLEAAIGSVGEGPQLDFKEAISTKSDEIAKDIAAMTIHGGVLVYGVAEKDGFASALAPVPLKGARERIQQIVDSAIQPVPEIEIDLLTASPGDNEGFIVVFIPASPLTPHYTHWRFPARSDTTTRYLQEPEIERLYEQRHCLLEPTPNADPLADFIPAEGGLDARSSYGGIGVERLTVAPIAPLRHPRGAWLESPLEAAVHGAVATVGPLVAPKLEPKTFDFLQKWRARGTVGWQAGCASDKPETLKQSVLVAATYTYEGRFSFVVTISVIEEDGSHPVAFEHLWVVETMAMLSVAGHFFADAGAALLDVGMGLQGLDGAVSYKASDGRAFHAGQPQIKGANYFDQLRVSSRALADDPREATRQLFERLFASFLTPGDDVIAGVARGH